VGMYDDAIGATSYQQDGLLENLSDGVWRATTAPIPGDPDDGVVNLSSVSCADPTSCTAVGVYSYDTWTGLIYTWSAGTWQIQAIPPLPADYDNSLNLTGVSCPDADDCTVIGRYGNANDYMSGLILTMSDGVWTSMTAPLPANATSDQSAVEPLDAVDCPESNYCVAGGIYQIPPPVPLAPGHPYPGQTYVGLLLVDQSGVWTPVQAPVPDDVPDLPVYYTDFDSNITGVYCSAGDSCTATGWYNFDDQATYLEDGMLLSQGTDGSWSAVTAPLPTEAGAAEARHRSQNGGRSHAVRKGVGTTATTSSSGSTVNGVSCGGGGFCVAAGTDDTSGLIETGQGRSQPTVSGVTPSSGPTSGGTDVDITGSGFTADTTVQFGGIAASGVTFVNANEMSAVAPAVTACPGPVDVTVGVAGVVSRANFSDLFSYEDPDSCPSFTSFTPASGAVGSSVTISGSNLGGATQVTFDGTPAVITSAIATQVVATVPLGQDTGLIVVTTPSGEVATTTSFQLEGFYALPAALPEWSGSPYDAQLPATGGKAPYKWKLVSGKLPKGLKLSSGGELSGRSAKKATPGLYSFTVQATDSTKKKHNTSEANYTVQVG
jgi:hypothetical protein